MGISGSSSFLPVFVVVLFLAIPVSLYAADTLPNVKRQATVTLPAPEKTEVARFSLPEIIQYALAHNPTVRIGEKEIQAEKYNIDSAWARRMPKIDFNSSATSFRYPTPVMPIVIPSSPTAGFDVPEFKKTLYDIGATVTLPVFTGGRLMRGVRVAELRKAIAEDTLRLTRQELTFNLVSVFYKIVQLEKLREANNATVRQLERHKENVELFLKTGTVAQLDLLKIDVELSHAIEGRLKIKNNIESAYELLKTLMGMADTMKEIKIHDKEAVSTGKTLSILGELEKAYGRRPDYRAVEKKRKIMEERVKIAQGRRLPEIAAGGEYMGRSGPDNHFKENWYAGVKMTVPVFDGGLIAAEINKERMELEKVKEEERFLRLTISREVKDAVLAIENAKERILVTEKSILSAREAVRVENLKFETGAGATTDVIDAQAALLRAESEYYQAICDRETALAFLKKATGEDLYQ